MPINRQVSPVLDGAAVALSGGVRERSILIPEGEYATPFWVRFDGGTAIRVDTLPWRYQGAVGEIEVLTPATALPSEYSLSRALLTSNPTALIWGYDWEDSPVLGAGGDQFWNQDPFSVYVDPTANAVPNGPGGAKMVEYVADPVFGQVVRTWHTDGSDGKRWHVSGEANWTGRDRVWYRLLVKFQSGFALYDATSTRSWKFFFADPVRRVEMAFTTGDHLSAATQPAGSPWGGSEAPLPGDPQQGVGANWFRTVSDSAAWTDEEWYEYIHCSERLSASSFRARTWVRKVSTADTLITPVPLDKIGQLRTGATVPANPTTGISLSEVLNSATDPGVAQWLLWGPMEAIDGDVIADPYGLAADMLT